VLGKRGERGIPENPSDAAVWKAILAQIDVPQSESKYISAVDAPRVRFARHPWNIGGGGAAELKETLDTSATRRLVDLISVFGRVAHTGADEVYQADCETLKRFNIPPTNIAQVVAGEQVRDWIVDGTLAVLFPYSADLTCLKEDDGHPVFRRLWPHRALLWNRREPNGTHREIGKTWYEFSRFHPDRYKGPCVASAYVTTHNHFAFDEGEKVFNQGAPAIKLSPPGNREDYRRLECFLNSSVACFWMKQVCFPKGGDQVGHEGARVRLSLWDVYFHFNATALKELPLPADDVWPLAEAMCRCQQEMRDTLPSVFLSRLLTEGKLTQNGSDEAKARFEKLRGRMIAIQEELDWWCYEKYSLSEHALVYDREPPTLQLGQRAFEIVMARKVRQGEIEPVWFDRHGAEMIEEVPREWPDEYRALVEKRITTIEANPSIGLIEQPDYKRRWSSELWSERAKQSIERWLLNRLESYFDLDGRISEGESPSQQVDLRLLTTAHLADLASRDSCFMRAAELYRERQDFDVPRLVAELVEDESVPHLSVLRYKAVAMEKRRAWERTWDLQRQEDAIDARTKLPSDHPGFISEFAALQEKQRLVGDIPIPPGYKSTDFQKTTYWRLRGKLDVPKERWVSFPHCEGEDQSAVVAWAGYDHLQLAQAVGTYYAEIKEKGGTKDPRLVPLLAGIWELVPWLKQWHNDLDPTYNLRMGDYYAGFVEGEAKELEMTVQQIRDWQPPRQAGRRRRS
jgi:hypothetical protein